MGRIRLSAVPIEERIKLEPVVRVEPSKKEILRRVYLGLPLIYWILIGGGLLVLVILLLIVLFIRRLLRQRKRRQEQARRALNRIAE